MSTWHYLHCDSTYYGSTYYASTYYGIEDAKVDSVGRSIHRSTALLTSSLAASSRRPSTRRSTALTTAPPSPPSSLATGRASQRPGATPKPFTGPRCGVLFSRCALCRRSKQCECIFARPVQKCSYSYLLYFCFKRPPPARRAARSRLEPDATSQACSARASYRAHWLQLSGTHKTKSTQSEVRCYLWWACRGPHL